MEKRIVPWAAFLGMTAIILGAFGAHALKKVLDAYQLSIFETGVRYQMYHALFLLFVALAPISEKSKNRILYFVLGGVLLFSGSLYLLATNPIEGFDFKSIGFVTPVGGLLLIIAWLLLLIDFMRRK